jgi:predicted enzyme related to lactoylglutathione lyase
MAFEHLGTKYDITPGSVTIDSDDAASLASWWADLLGVEVKDHGGFYWLMRQEGGRFNLAIQQVPEAKSGKNRVHVDFAVSDLIAVSDQIVAAGGSMLAEHTAGEFVWRVMADPQGNEFCIITE